RRRSRSTASPGAARPSRRASPCSSRARSVAADAARSEPAATTTEPRPPNRGFHVTASDAAFPAARPRRLRRGRALRRLVAETAVRPENLILPMFVKEGLTEPVPISSMPGQVQHTKESLRKAAAEAAEAGVGGLMLFGIPEHKDTDGTQADDPNGVVQEALSDLSAEVGDDIVLMAD